MAMSYRWDSEVANTLEGGIVSVHPDVGPWEVNSTTATASSESRTLPLEIRLFVTDDEYEAVLNGEIIPNAMERLELEPDLGERFIHEVKSKAEADGLDLTDEEARTLANLMLMVGLKLADEME